MRIIYNDFNSKLCIIHPAPDCDLTLEQIAAKDVPAGLPYRIVEDDVIPSDRTFRGAWTADMSSPDGVGADFGVGSANAVVAWDETRDPVLRVEA